MTSVQIDYIFRKQRLFLKRKRLIRHYEGPIVMAIISLVFLAIPFKFYLLDKKPFEQEAVMFLLLPILTLALFLNQYLILRMKKVETSLSKKQNHSVILSTLESLNWYVTSNNNDFIEAFNPKRDFRTWGDEMISIAIDDSTILINSICNVDGSRSQAALSFGKNRQNMRAFIKAYEIISKNPT